MDSEGKLRDTYTFWFREVTARGYPRRRARTVIGMKVHELLRYAYHHGVKTLFLENPNVLGKLRLLWIRNGRRLHRNYNWKVATFKSLIIEVIALKAPLYAMNTKYIDLTYSNLNYPKLPSHKFLPHENSFDGFHIK